MALCAYLLKKIKLHLKLKIIEISLNEKNCLWIEK